MQFPLDLLLHGHGDPLCVERDLPIRDALRLMIEHDYSQLPVIDEHGQLSGIISEQTLVRSHFHSNGKVALLDLPVNHVEEPVVQLSPSDDTDVFTAMDLLRGTYAVVVVRDKKPIGIITDYDTTQFFRSISGDLLLIEDIELTLRRRIKAVLHTERALQAALFSAFGQDKRDPAKPGRDFERLDFGEHIQLITEERNWSKFSKYFEPKPLFVELMHQVRDIRNQLMHFRGRSDAVQHDALERARDWLTKRPMPLPRETAHLLTLDLSTVERLRGHKRGKYEPLRDWLMEQSDDRTRLRVRLDDIERLIGETLPPSAFGHQSWWANDTAGHTQSQAWLHAGWDVEDVDLSAGEVVFRRRSAAA